MDLQLIKKLCENYDGGIKKLASDIDMSEANLHRCIRNNKIEASDLEKIASRLNVRVGLFFGEKELKQSVKTDSDIDVEALFKELNMPKDSDKIIAVWMRFMEITKEMQELYKKASKEI